MTQKVRRSPPAADTLRVGTKSTQYAHTHYRAVTGCIHGVSTYRKVRRAWCTCMVICPSAQTVRIPHLQLGGSQRERLPAQHDAHGLRASRISASVQHLETFAQAVAVSLSAGLVDG